MNKSVLVAYEILSVKDLFTMLCLTFAFFIVSVMNGLVKTDECKTPNNETAQCISLYSCPILLTAASDPTKRDFVRQSSCGGTAAEPMVCCGMQSNFTIQKQTKTVSDNILPNKRVCGLQHSDDYYHTVNGTVLTEFPWLALIEYRKDDGGSISPKFRCSGSLIHNKYVLTTAGCILYKGLIAVGVRLGEYNTNTNDDCMEDAHIYECSDFVQDYKIEKSVVHPAFYKFTGVNDIGLLRLNGSVYYTDYIRPICLPVPGLKTAKLGDTLTTSGWGFEGGVKKRIFSRLITLEECKDLGTLTIEDNDGCGLITAVNGSQLECDNHRGGPVMFSHRAKWIQEGIMLYSKCMPDQPHVYVKVALYVDWIKDNIQP